MPRPRLDLAATAAPPGERQAGARTGPALLELLAAIRDELHALRLAVERVPGPVRHEGDVAAAELLRAIHAGVADRIFSAGDLLIHSRLPIGAAIDAAIVASIGIANARQLGKCFARIEGRELGGYVCRRVSSDGAGILWSVHRVS